MNIPNSIAIILDGNGRWAVEKGFPRSYGHVIGCENLENICSVVQELGVKYLTVYAFSTENWSRSNKEVKVLMNLFRRYFHRLKKKALKDQIRVRVIGSRENLAKDILSLIGEMEEETKQFSQMTFQICLNYGSRDELTRAVRNIATDCKEDILRVEDITEETIGRYLDTDNAPDLLIRTGGEMRVSNFLLWQIAYSEMYFTDVKWPDFKREQLMEAIEEFNGRDRRFGNAESR